MARSVNAETLAHVKRWEGFRADAYPDPGSVDGKPVTIGYGQTRRMGRAIELGERISEAEAEQWLRSELDRVGAVVERLAKVPLTDNQFGALTSFTYNVGDGAFERSTLLKKLNAGDYAAVPAQIARWNKNDGKVMQGLVNRRNAEIELWSTPSAHTPPEAPIPVTPLPEPATKSSLGLKALVIAFLILFALAVFAAFSFRF